MNTTFYMPVEQSRRLFILSDLRVQLANASNEHDYVAAAEAMSRIREFELLPPWAPIALSRREADIAYPEVVARHYGLAA